MPQHQAQKGTELHCCTGPLQWCRPSGTQLLSEDLRPWTRGVERSTGGPAGWRSASPCWGLLGPDMESLILPPARKQVVQGRTLLSTGPGVGGSAAPPLYPLTESGSGFSWSDTKRGSGGSASPPQPQPAHGTSGRRAAVKQQD